MRICILANALSVHTQRWARAYADRGHEVHVLSIRYVDIPDVQLHTVCIGPINSDSKIWTLLSYVWLLASARRRLKHLTPDVVHAHYTVTHGVIAAFSGFKPVLLSAWGKDVIWDGPGKMPWYLRAINRYALNRASAASSTSQYMAPHVRQFIDRELDVYQIPFGCDTGQFRPCRCWKERADRGTIRIGFIKSLQPKYGPEYLIRAMPRVLATVPEARLVMAGQGVLLEPLQRLTNDLGITDYVDFVGALAHHEVPEVMRHLDIYINCSVAASESFGVVVLEASACEVPVIATNIGGVSEVCLDGETGIMVPPANEVALADAILKLAKNHKLRQQLGVSGRRFVREKYNWSQNVDAMLTVLDNLKSANSKDSPQSYE